MKLICKFAILLLCSEFSANSQVIFDDEPEETTPRRQFGNNFQVVISLPPGSTFRRPTQQSQQQQSFQKPNNNGFGSQQNPNSNGFGSQQNTNSNGFQGGQQGDFPPPSGFNNFQSQDQSGFQKQNQVVVSSRSPDCRTYQNAGGFCTPLTACGRIARVIQNRSPFVAARILRRSICGFSGVVPSVCCPTGRHGQEPPPQHVTGQNSNNFGSGNFMNNNNQNTNNDPGFGFGNNGAGLSNGNNGAGPSNGNNFGTGPSNGNNLGANPSNGNNFGANPSNGNNFGANPNNGNNFGTNPNNGNNFATNPNNGNNFGANPNNNNNFDANPNNGNNFVVSPTKGNNLGADPSKVNNNGPGLVILPPPTSSPTTTTTTTTPPPPLQIITQRTKKPFTNPGAGGLIIGDGPIALLPAQSGGGSTDPLGFSAEGLPDDCGFSNASHTRIVGGKIAEKGAWPWIAALGYKDEAGNVNYLCGGALISPNYVITAAHCLHGRDDLASVRLGDHDIFSTSDNVQPLEVEVDKRILHPKYDPSTFKNDIALLHLKRSVQYSRQIHPVCLPNTPKLRNERFENTSPFVAGWGAIQFNGPSSSVLREVQVPTIPDSVCQEKYSSFKTAVVDDTNICAGLRTGGKDACQGDSGGPLQQPVGSNRYVLIGVVSFGFKCAEPDFPGIYTRVTSHVDWIQSTIKQ